MAAPRARAPSVSTSTDSESEGPLQHQRPRRRRSRQHSTGAPGNLPLPSVLHRNNAPQSIAPSRSIDSSTFDWADITLAVVGSARCGKSTVIDKGLRAYKLVNPSQYPAGTIPAAPRLTYSVREGVIPREGLPDRTLNVLELDAKVLEDSANPGAFRWPEGQGVPHLDACIVCYDVSDPHSVDHVETLLRCFQDLKLPVIVFACKSDKDRAVHSTQVYTRISKLDVGLVEVSSLDEKGKDQLKLGFNFLLRAISTQRARMIDPEHYTNPASPDVLVSPPPWDISRASTATPTTAATAGPSRLSQQPFSPPTQIAPSSSASTPRSPNAPTSPTRSRSASDLLSLDSDKSRSLDRDKSRSTLDMSVSSRTSVSIGASDGPQPPDALAHTDSLPSVDEATEERASRREKEGKAASYATLDELLEKLLFLAVSGDDPAFIAEFLLTYRRFMSPRSVVLAMQKRMRWLDQPSSDPMFACFAQMRICHLLESWIEQYPHDFAVGAAAAALNALVRAIVSKSHLLHYGSDFLPFLESRPLVDSDAPWALKVQEPAGDGEDDRYSLFEDDDDDDDHDHRHAPQLLPPPAHPRPPAPRSAPVRDPDDGKPRAAARERKSSLPLSAKALMDPGVPQNSPDVDMSPKTILRELQSISAALERIDPDVVAQEITRVEKELFIRIKPRHWLQHALTSGKKEPDRDTIACFSEVSYHIADWVTSLILCHDKPRLRARQIERLVEIAARLRYYNNYSALRAFVAAIHTATHPGDAVMEDFQRRAPGLYKTFQSWELLLKSAGSHRAYRMALKNTKGACIPAVEVHVLDLIRAQEGNKDWNSDDASKVHWAKFSMMGRFILATAEQQARCRDLPDYAFRDGREHAHVRSLLMRECLMDPDMQRTRRELTLEAMVDEEPGMGTIRPSQPPAQRDTGLIKRLLSTMR
ncbi:ras GEF [Peniophora sp. CONT]|nr:ras GEF [Peniophora sp. CONT]